MNEDHSPAQGIHLTNVLRFHTECIRCMAYSANGQVLLTASGDGRIGIWSPLSGHLVGDLTWKMPDMHPMTTVTTIALTSNGDFAICGTSWGDLQVWDVSRRELLFRARPIDLQEHTVFDPAVRGAAFTADGSCVYLAGDGVGSAELAVWEWRTSLGAQSVLHLREAKPPYVRVVADRDLGLVRMAMTDGGRNILSASASRNQETGKLMEFSVADTGSQRILAEFSAGNIGGFALHEKTNRIAVTSGVDVLIIQRDTGQLLTRLEGHTDTCRSLSFSASGRLLASRAADNTVRLWRTDSWKSVLMLAEPLERLRSHFAGHEGQQELTFHPSLSTLASLGDGGRSVRTWEIDEGRLLKETVSTGVQYSNAKVVLVGDSGVGKSGLGLVLTNQPFESTDSTHGRRVWTFASEEVTLPDGRSEVRETLLWDLAGQPGYRIIHQLHLTEVAVALVVFDSRSETDPFAGVRHWDKALRQAQQVFGLQRPIRKLLVAARADRGGIGVSRARIDATLKSLGFDAFYETSAREGWNIAELSRVVRDAIPWDTLPHVSSTELFQTIKTFLVEEKESGQLLATVPNLMNTFMNRVIRNDPGEQEASAPASLWRRLKASLFGVEGSQGSVVTGAELLRRAAEDAPESGERLRAAFEACIDRVEARGLIRRLNFGNLVLLQPEYIDAYASAIINAAKDEPDGMGCIPEEDAKTGRFRLSADERLPDRDQEQLLLLATVEDLLRHEIALRMHSLDGAYLVFPSQFTRELPHAPEPEEKAVVFHFDGPVLSIYSTLAVRLSHSEIFVRKEMWKNAATYQSSFGGTCGMYLREVSEGTGELALFYSEGVLAPIRSQFEDFIQYHLRARSLSGTLSFRRPAVCRSCGFLVTDQLTRIRLQRGFDWLDCPGCGQRLGLVQSQDPISARPAAEASRMERSADAQRDRNAAALIVEGKIATQDFDVFLCHNVKDKEIIRRLGHQLMELGLLPWLDEWELRPGLPWQRCLEAQISNIKAAAVFVGPDGIGPWMSQEIDAFLREFVRRNCPVIPVRLPGAPPSVSFPVFLNAMTWIDLAVKTPDPVDQLIWGITGRRGSRNG